MKNNKKRCSKKSKQVEGKLTNNSSIQFLDLTPGQWEEMRRQEINWMLKHYGPRGQRAIKEARQLNAEIAALKLGKFAEIGVFFLWASQILTSSRPWKLNPVAYGFHIYLVSHMEYWQTLQSEGKVPLDITYDLVPRGRVIFNEETCTFTLLADPCIVNRKDLVMDVISKFNLPLGTAVAADAQYLCKDCLNHKTRGGPNYGLDGEWSY